MLRIHYFGFAWVVPKKISVKQVDIFDYTVGIYIERIFEKRRGQTGRFEITSGKPGNGLDSVTDIRPELVEITRSWETAAHANYCDAHRRSFRATIDHGIFSIC